MHGDMFELCRLYNHYAAVLSSRSLFVENVVRSCTFAAKLTLSFVPRCLSSSSWRDFPRPSAYPSPVLSAACLRGIGDIGVHSADDFWFPYQNGLIRAASESVKLERGEGPLHS